MGISIHVDDISNESPEDLAALGEFLLKVAGKPTVLALPAFAGDEGGDAASPPPAAPAPSAAPAPALASPPPPPPAPSAASAPPVPPFPPSAPLYVLPERDKRGFLWDARIHSEAKTRNNDGTWRYRRGIKDDVIGPVEAELRAAHGIPIPPTAQDAPPASAQDAPPPPPAPDSAQEAPPPPPVEYDPHALVNLATKALSEKRITQAQLTDVLKEYGLPFLGAVFERRDLVKELHTRIQALIVAGGAA